VQKYLFFTQDLVAFLSVSQYIIAKTLKKGYIQIKKLKCIDVIKRNYGVRIRFPSKNPATALALLF
jgi:hypothetical protein